MRGKAGEDPFNQEISAIQFVIWQLGSPVIGIWSFSCLKALSKNSPLSSTNSLLDCVPFL